ncbi:MAG: aerobic carbon-monoxide dehydrogenase small subunit [Solirubrobacteraceae bacterium]
MSEIENVALTVNAQARSGAVEPRLLLVDFLRDDLRLTGVHIGCDDGVCGACTVLVDGQPAKSCLMLAVQANGAEVTTVEGLGQPQSLHPVQQAFIDAGAVQCGFCTPGMVVAVAALLERNPDPDDAAIRAGLVGNICRCGGYQAIREAVRLAAQASRGLV